MRWIGFPIRLVVALFVFFPFVFVTAFLCLGFIIMDPKNTSFFSPSWKDITTIPTDFYHWVIGAK
jgi:hypothetical protein